MEESISLLKAKLEQEEEKNNLKEICSQNNNSNTNKIIVNSNNNISNHPNFIDTLITVLVIFDLIYIIIDRKVKKKSKESNNKRFLNHIFQIQKD